MTQSLTDRRTLLKGAAASAALLAPGAIAGAEPPGQRSRGDPKRRRCRLRGVGAPDPAMDRAPDHRRRAAECQEGADHMARLATEAGFTGVRKVPTGRRAGGVRNARRGRGADGRHLFHVRRQAIRSRGMGLAAARRADFRSSARPRHSRPRRDQPERARRRLPRRAARVQGRKPAAAGQSRAAGGGRGGDRLAQFHQRSFAIPPCWPRCAGPTG